MDPYFSIISTLSKGPAKIHKQPNILTFSKTSKKQPQTKTSLMALGRKEIALIISNWIGQVFTKAADTLSTGTHTRWKDKFLSVGPCLGNEAC